MVQITRGRLVAAFATAVVVAGFLYLFQTPPVPVDTAQVDIGSLEVTVDEEAITRIREVYTISAPIAGRVERTRLKVGDPIEAGETIVATITPKPPDFLDDRTATTLASNVKAAEAALLYSKASVEKVQAELTFARQDLARAEELSRRGTVSERTRDEARMKVATLTAALANARADVEVKSRQLDAARAQLIQPGTLSTAAGDNCCVTVHAPASGRVLKLLVESTQVVNAGTPLLEIGDTDDIEVVVELLSTDAVKVEPGMRAYVERWGGPDTLVARVRRVEPAGFKYVSALGIEEQRVKVRLDMDDATVAKGRLGHDYRVFLRIVIWHDENALRIPISSLFRHGPHWAVFVKSDGKARIRTISIGQRNAKHAQALDGLKEGERVILHPSDRIKDGISVVERTELQ
jgi:HlyD family secretion protein